MLKSVFAACKSNVQKDLFEMEIFCNIINGFTVTFDQFNVSLKNRRLLLLFSYTPHFEWCCISSFTKILSRKKQLIIINNRKILKDHITLKTGEMAAENSALPSQTFWISSYNKTLISIVTILNINDFTVF